MRDFMKVIKRYKILLLIELLAIIAVTVFLLNMKYRSELILINWQKVEINGESLTVGHIIWGIIFCIGESLLYATTPVVLVFTFIRYIIYDNKNQKILNCSFPLSNSQKTIQEMLLGGIPITISGVFYSASYACYDCFINLYDDTITRDSNHVLRWFLENLGIIVVLLGAYAFLVFARKVSASIGGLILLYITGVFLVVYITTETDSLLSMSTGNGFLYNVFMYFVMFFPLLISVTGLIIADKKLDIAKGGSYYFKPVQIAVCFFSGVSFLIWMLGFFDTKKDGLNALYVIISIIISLVVTACVFFLTKERKHDGKRIQRSV